MKTERATETRQTAWRLIRAGYNASELALALGVHKGQAHRWLRRLTPTMNQPSPRPAQRLG